MPQLSQRLAKHKCDYQRYLQRKTNKMMSSYEVLKNNNYEIVLLELYPCSCKEELHKRERWYIENIACVNQIIPTRTNKEYYEDHKSYIVEYKAEYYEQNKERLQQKAKAYYEENKAKINRKETITCECGLTITKCNRSRHCKSKNHQKYIASFS
jgi:hypothetical protein